MVYDLSVEIEILEDFVHFLLIFQFASYKPIKKYIRDPMQFP